MNIKEAAERHNGYIVAQRRRFHAHPELSFEERETTAAIRGELEAMGIAVETFPDYYGLIGTIEGGKPGATVMLRADIDAAAVCLSAQRKNARLRTRRAHLDAARRGEDTFGDEGRAQRNGEAAVSSGGGILPRRGVLRRKGLP